MGKLKMVDASGDAEGAVSDAYSTMDGIKDELQSWYDNLPENFQSGDKGDQLQTAIDAIESVSEPTAPDHASEIACSWREYVGKFGRPKQRDNAVAALRAAGDAVRARVEELGQLTFEEPDDEDKDPEETTEVESVNGAEVKQEEPEKVGDEAITEDERDTMVDELETYADEIEAAADEYDNVEFPGMFG